MVVPGEAAVEHTTSELMPSGMCALKGSVGVSANGFSQKKEVLGASQRTTFGGAIYSNSKTKLRPPAFSLFSDPKEPRRTPRNPKVCIFCQETVQADAICMPKKYWLPCVRPYKGKQGRNESTTEEKANSAQQIFSAN